MNALLLSMAVGCKFAEAPQATPTCETACANLNTLGCVEAQPSESGRTCADTCVRVSRIVRLDIACISSATSVSAVRVCRGITCD